MSCVQVKFIHDPSRHVQRHGLVAFHWECSGNATNHDAELGEKDSERTLCMHEIAWAPRVQPLSIGTA